MTFAGCNIEKTIYNCQNMQYHVDPTDMIQKVNENVIFGSLVHSYVHFCDPSIILNDLLMFSTVENRLVPS